MRNKPYCNAPWLGLAYEGTVGCKPCCEWKGDEFPGTYTDYIKSNYLKEFKDMLYEDKMNDGCIECIHNEQSGKPSRRKWFTSQAPWVKQSDPYDQEGIIQILRLDYRAGNKCNMMCRMCSPESSSLLEEEAGITIQRIDTSDVYDIDLSHLKELSILGGEPSIDVPVRKFIDHVTNTVDLDCSFIVTTNGTNASNKWFETLKLIKNLGIELSIDATGDVQDYQRKGGEWSKIKKNIIKYRDTFSNVCIHLSATAINFPVLDKWWDELLSLDIYIDLYPVHTPYNMNLDAIPDSYKEKQINWLQNWIINLSYKQPTDNWQRKINIAKRAITILETSKYNPKYNEQFIQWTNKLDNIRNENIRNIDKRFEVIMDER